MRLNTRAEGSELVSLHVQDRYKHSMRYFGLLAPRFEAHNLVCPVSAAGAKPAPSSTASVGRIPSARTFR
jgi:hypothetical protein